LWQSRIVVGAPLFLCAGLVSGSFRDMSKQSAQYWMVKSEPTAYGWSTFVTDGRTAWTGVRNFAARLNLRAMRKGDKVLFYHSVEGKEIVGLAEVATEAYRDPTAKEGDWSCVDLVPVKPLPHPVSLAEIKENPKLQEMKLLRQSRLSVMPITPAEFAEIERMSKAK
jgi:predicted RNA-binding protein with PUA-like domain